MFDCHASIWHRSLPDSSGFSKASTGLSLTLRSMRVGASLAFLHRGPFRAIIGSSRLVHPYSEGGFLGTVMLVVVLGLVGQALRLSMDP